MAGESNRCVVDVFLDLVLVLFVVNTFLGLRWFHFDYERILALKEKIILERQRFSLALYIQTYFGQNGVRPIWRIYAKYVLHSKQKPCSVLVTLA